MHDALPSSITYLHRPALDDFNPMDFKTSSIVLFHTRDACLGMYMLLRSLGTTLPPLADELFS